MAWKEHKWLITFVNLNRPCMSSVTIHDKEFVIYLEEEKIQKAIEEVAAQLTQKYEGKDVVFVGVLNYIEIEHLI